jgi:putative endonuclease
MLFLHHLLAAIRPGGATAVLGEWTAARYLRSRGYRILARNLRNRFGEVDILAQDPDGRTVVVVEVKAAVPPPGNPRDPSPSAAAAVRPEEHVNRHKQRKLAALAGQLVRRYRLEDRPVRFDVVGVDLPRRARPIIRHHLGAFESHV